MNMRVTPGQPRHWVEVAPFLSQDPDSHERLAARVVDGRVVRFSIDELSPFMVFDRVPWYRDNTWLLPASYGALGALAILAALGVWAFALGRMLNDLNYLGAKSDALLRFAQLLGLLAFIGGWLALLWNLIHVWTGARRWPARLWSIVLLAAASVVLWIAATCHLLGLGLDY